MVHYLDQKICHQNLSIAFPKLDEIERNKILKKMWCNYGKIFAEYIFIKKFRKFKNFKIIVENQRILE